MVELALMESVFVPKDLLENTVTLMPVWIFLATTTELVFLESVTVPELVSLVNPAISK